MASSSSIKHDAGCLLLCLLKQVCTLEEQTFPQTPEMLKGTPASPATAFAIRVLPVPEGLPTGTPLGIRAPIAIKRVVNHFNELSFGLFDACDIGKWFCSLTFDINFALLFYH